MSQKPIYGFSNPLRRATNKPLSQLVGSRQEKGAQRCDQECEHSEEIPQPANCSFTDLVFIEKHFLYGKLNAP